MSEPRRFRAASIRDAMDEVARVLGPDAVVVRTRRLSGGGVEVWAHAARRAAPVRTGRTGGSLPADEPSRAPRRPSRARALSAIDEEHAERLRSVVSSLPDLEAMLREVELLRHATRSGAHSPERPGDALAAPLEAAGIEPGVARAVAARARARALDGQGATALAAVDLEAELARVLRTTPPPWKRAGRVAVALVGPPGAGRTTVAARMAAEAAFRAGRSVLLVSVDPLDRPAWVLDTLAEALGIRCERVSSPGALAVLGAKSPHDFIAIDTAVGVGSDAAAERATGAMLDEIGAERHLVLPLTWDIARLRGIVQASEPAGIGSLILTRLDQVGSPGAVWSVLWRHPHPVSLLSEGNDVPGGLVEACGLALARRTLRQAVAVPA